MDQVAGFALHLLMNNRVNRRGIQHGDTEFTTMPVTAVVTVLDTLFSHQVMIAASLELPAK